MFVEVGGQVIKFRPTNLSLFARSRVSQAMKPLENRKWDPDQVT
jgi:hypothetical protein